MYARLVAVRPFHERQVLSVLSAGFALMFVLATVSGFVVMNTMEFIESDAERFAAEQQATARLINEVQSEEGNLSAVFYSLASGRGDVDGEPLLKRLDALETAIHRTTDIGAASKDAAPWRKVRLAADAFIAEGRDTLKSQRRPSPRFFERHQNLLAALAELTGSTFSSSSALSAEQERLSGRIHYSLWLLGAAMAVAAVGAMLMVSMVNRMFRRLRWQASELARLSSRTITDREDTARRLSREMHDHFGQTLSAIEANLVSMQRARAYHSGRIEDCLGLVKDAVENVREVSQLLRPSILDDFGLDMSLRWLADGFADRSGKTVNYSCSFTARLDGAVETQLFRITQEALTNVARHADATTVRIELAADAGRLMLTISDNGSGMDPELVRAGSGLVGMRARARAVGAEITVSSRPGDGVLIRVQVPLRDSEYAAQDSHPVGR
jgi:signal transduction histidine kinase